MSQPASRGGMGSDGGANAPLIGRVIAGRYKIQRLLARGGMGSVYLADHIQLHRPVAVKILASPPGADDAMTFHERFRLEAETLGALNHPNIVTLYDYGQTEQGQFFLAMEYVEGPRLTDLIKDGPLAPVRSVALMLQVCAGLRYAHRRGVVHRDLKPSNLLIRQEEEEEEQVKLVDFGLVKVLEMDQGLTREGMIVGSPHCMSPEQIRGEPVDHRADIYAIGVLLYRAVTGHFPFHGITSTATMMSHLNDPVPSFASVAPQLAFPPGLEAIVRRCLAKDPTDRYADVRPLMEDLGECVGIGVEVTQVNAGSGRASSAPSAPPSTKKGTISVGGRPVWGPLVVGAGLVLVALGLWGGVQLGAWAVERLQPPPSVQVPVQPPVEPAPVEPPAEAPAEKPAGKTDKPDKPSKPKPKPKSGE